MDGNKLVAELETLVEAACRRKTNVFGYEIWEYHVRPVVEYGVELAAPLGADPEIVRIAALLHDYAAIKDVTLQEDHHLHGAYEAERLLNAFGYPALRIEAVRHCILTHRNSVPLRRETPEAVCVASADAMAHIAQVASLLHLAYAQKGLTVAEGKQWVRDKIAKSWKKLCPEAKGMMREHYAGALLILTDDSGPGRLPAAVSS